MILARLRLLVVAPISLAIAFALLAAATPASAQVIRAFTTRFTPLSSLFIHFARSEIDRRDFFASNSASPSSSVRCGSLASTSFATSSRLFSVD